MMIYHSERFVDKKPEDIRQFISDYANRHGVSQPLPSVLYVDAVTYGRCCQAVFDWMKNNHIKYIALGLNNGLMFKGIELILEE